MVDTSVLSNDELELWYGSKFAVSFLRLIEGYTKLPHSMFYFKNDNNLMGYKANYLYVSFQYIISPLAEEFQYKWGKVIQLIKEIFKKHFDYNIIDVFTFN